jgi:hypothetical protein
VSDVYSVQGGTYNGDYYYTYQMSGSAPKLDVFTVETATGDPSKILDILVTSANWSGSFNNGDVSWTSVPPATDTPAAGVKYSFYSPLLPEMGDSFAQDLTTWSELPGANGVYVPGIQNNLVPDGGVTVALLGLALVGIEGLRRKQSK